MERGREAIDRGLAIPGTRPRDLPPIAQAILTWRNTLFANTPNRAVEHDDSLAGEGQEVVMDPVEDPAVIVRTLRRRMPQCLLPTRHRRKKVLILCRRMGMWQVNNLLRLRRLHRQLKHRRTSRSSLRRNHNLSLLLSLNLLPVHPRRTIMNLPQIALSRDGMRLGGRT